MLLRAEAVFFLLRLQSPDQMSAVVKRGVDEDAFAGDLLGANAGWNRSEPSGSLNSPWMMVSTPASNAFAMP
jgi:hypothetical protein